MKCPECAALLDVEEGEVEEGEILTCPECEAELEVVQAQPVHLNVISDEDELGDEEDEDEEELDLGDESREDEEEEK